MVYESHSGMGGDFRILDRKKQIKSNTYSLKLDHLFKASFATISKSPEIGRPTDFPFVRIKVIRDYIVYYRVTPENIEILTVRDSRRNPKKFDL